VGASGTHGISTETARPYKNLSLKELSERLGDRNQAVDSLRVAVDELRRVERRFDDASQLCNCCNRMSWIYEDEAKIHRSTEALIKRMHKLKSSIMQDHTSIVAEINLRS